MNDDALTQRQLDKVRSILGDLVTMKDFAAEAGVADSTIQAYKTRGYLPEPVGQVGVQPVWLRPQLDQWLRSRPAATA